MHVTYPCGVISSIAGAGAGPASVWPKLSPSPLLFPPQFRNRDGAEEGGAFEFVISWKFVGSQAVDCKLLFGAAEYLSDGNWQRFPIDDTPIPLDAAGSTIKAHSGSFSTLRFEVRWRPTTWLRMICFSRMLSAMDNAGSLKWCSKRRHTSHASASPVPILIRRMGNSDSDLGKC